MVLLVALLMFTILTGLAGCKGSDTTAENEDSTGELIVSLTDAEGDFASYTVDVVALTLTKANGVEVDTLPLSARVDFAQYTDMTEFLTTVTIPSGVYVAAHMTLDYTQADIWVENAEGDLIEVETIVDGNGGLLDELEMTVQLEDRNQLLIAPGIPMHLQLDFDLKATNSVSFDAEGVPTVTVDPYLIADVNRTDSKIHRLRGLLDSVDPGDNEFLVFIRPFYAALSGSHRHFGRMTVSCDTNTLYEIDGESFQGQDGLEAMSVMDPLSAIVVVGDLEFNPLRFEADQVYAGTSVPWGNQDIVSGSVLARDENNITIKGATLVRSNGSVIFHDVVSVTVGPDTRVTRQLSLSSYTTADISIGQHVAVFGTLTETDPGSLSLDAGEGRVHLKMSRIRGSVGQVDPDAPVAQLTVALQSINNCRVGVYDFSGTGTDSDNDADPLNYEVNTAELDLSNLDTDDPVKVWGFVQPFGAAPQDFNAHTIIRVADAPAFLKIHWWPPSTTAVDEISENGITLNLSGVGLFHHVFRAGVYTDLTVIETGPTLAPRSDGRGLFIIRLGGAVQVLLTFDDFTETLEDYLDDAWQTRRVHARGNFDDATATLNVDLIDIDLD
jgi:hypothetical protein